MLILLGLLAAASKCHAFSLTTPTSIDGDDFVASGLLNADLSTGIGDRFKISTVGQLLYVTCQLATFLSQIESTKSNTLRLQKQSARLQGIIDDVRETTENRSEVEVRCLRLHPGKY